MVRAVRSTERALGQAHYGPTQREIKTLRFRRSLFVVENVNRGAIFTHDNVRSIRPATGLHPRHLPTILGGAPLPGIFSKAHRLLGIWWPKRVMGQRPRNKPSNRPQRITPVAE